MVFHYIICIYPLLLTVLTAIINWNGVFCLDNYKSSKRFNRTLFKFDDAKSCAKNEFYDLNYFTCIPCATIGEHLQATGDKFSCVCKSTTTTDLSIFNAIKPLITCSDICSQHQRRKNHSPKEIFTNYCQTKEITTKTNDIPKLNCQFKFINHTTTTAAYHAAGDFSKKIEITNINWQYDGLCDECNLQYNFRYQDYCIANGLLRPYLSYNSFWQVTSTTQHFGDLKFVAFFCMALHNQTACNQLANLCVLSYYSFDKNSPCSKFLLHQASDAVYRYASIDDDMTNRQMKPFLYYRKGKETIQELKEPIQNLKYSLDSKKSNNHLQFFTLIHALDGTLLRWGPLKINDFNFCQNFKNNLNFGNFLRFAFKYDFIECSMTVEDMIDLAKIYANNRFISLFLNFTKNNKDTIFLQSIPILIEDLTAENERHQKEDWQLVKRFQLIEVHSKHGLMGSKASSPLYEDNHKLHLYKSMRYAERIELHYDIHSNNQISIPILKIRFRHIEFANNISLDTLLNFKLIITYERIGETTKVELINDIALPLSLLFAMVTALFKGNNTRKRRATSTSASNNNEDFCHFTYFTEFLLHLVSYMALAFLICFLLHVFLNSLTFLTQHNVELTLPIVKDSRSLEFIVYAAFILKMIYVTIYFWRLSHFHIFFIDWERPRCGDTTHFNMKNNLETSSVCSSVRTFISDTNVSAWRSILLANEWIHLSGKQKTSMIFQGLAMVVVSKIFNIDKISYDDITLKVFIISLSYILIYICQYVIVTQIIIRFMGNPIKKYIEHCSLANISVFALVEPSYGFYIHGRSPHGFADSDMTTMIMQLQRESQSICGRRGLLSDTDQCYIIMPPKNLSNYFDKLLLPYQRSFGGGDGQSRTHFQKEINNIEGTLEKTSIAYCSVNRFFCAFIDHGIKDMDYIIKEKSFVERLFDCEFDNYLTDNKGTFYIDTDVSFSQMFLYGNELKLFILQFLLLLAVYLMFSNLLVAVIVVCVFNKMFQLFYCYAIKENISHKTLIDKRFLM